MNILKLMIIEKIVGGRRTFTQGYLGGNRRWPGKSSPQMIERGSSWEAKRFWVPIEGLDG